VLERAPLWPVQTAGPAANLVGEVTKERGVGRLVERQLQPAIHAVDVAVERLLNSAKLSRRRMSASANNSPSRPVAELGQLRLLLRRPRSVRERPKADPDLLR
jgi:hypothetical protein